MKEDCTLCSNPTTKKVKIAFSSRPICQHCVDNIVEGEAMRANIVINVLESDLKQSLNKSE